MPIYNAVKYMANPIQTRFYFSMGALFGFWVAKF